MKNLLVQPPKKFINALLLLAGAALLTGCVGAGNFVWLDENGNGIQDAGEPGVEGVAVTLYRAPDESVAGTAVSDADGAYSISLQGSASDYYLRFSLPDGFGFTQQDMGSDDALDSDASTANGQTQTYILSSVVDNVDAGLIAEEAAAASQTEEEPTATLETVATATATVESAGGAALEQICYGPNPEDFPAGVSPLTGLPVDDPSLLDLRPVFLSVSIFPPSVRPPTGLAVSPIVYELYIGDGDTRLMAGFHGEFPEPTFEGGTGEGSTAPEADYVIGDRVWFDINGNHVQDDGEPGVPDVPVSLLDGDLSLVQETTTDGQGYYYFALNDLPINSAFQLRFGAPPSIADYYWVNKDVGGDDALDSDVTGLGRTDLFDPTDEDPGSQLNFDAGLRQAYRIEGLRSGRVAYQDLQVNYCGCLITAGADPTVAAQINTCANAFSSDPNNIGGAGLDVTQLQAVAAGSSEGVCAEPNLTGNEFCTQPEGVEGSTGQELYVEYNVNNVDHFVYDSELNAYTWAKNLPSAPDTFEVMTDRLTGETLTFENVIVMLVEHTSQNQANTIINLAMDHRTGTAFIFRNGQAYEARWTTVATPYEQTTGKPLPVRFTNLDGNPFPLAMGQIWVNLLNAFDSVEMGDGGIWYADFDAPAYAP